MFRSFFLAGFEGSTGYNRHGDWFDQVVATGHDRTVEQDYRDLAALGILSGAGIGALAAGGRRAGRYDFSSLDPFLDGGAPAPHRGDLGPVPLRLPQATSTSSRTTARAVRGLLLRGGALYRHAQRWAVPVHARQRAELHGLRGGGEGLVCPASRGRGWELKVALCRAAIAGIEALWAACPGSRIVNVDPLCRVAASPSAATRRKRRGTSTSGSSSRPGTCCPDGCCRNLAAAAHSRYRGHQLLLDQPVGMARRALAGWPHSPARR